MGDGGPIDIGRGDQENVEKGFLDRRGNCLGRIGGGVPPVPIVPPVPPVPVVPFLMPCPLPPARVLAVAVLNCRLGLNENSRSSAFTTAPSPLPLSLSTLPDDPSRASRDKVRFSFPRL